MPPARLSRSRLLRASLALAVGAAGVAGCGRQHEPPPRPAAARPQPPRLDASLQLPNSGGVVHVVAIPGELGEVTRCIVAMTPTGAVSTSCAPKEFEFPPEQ